MQYNTKKQSDTLLSFILSEKDRTKVVLNKWVETIRDKFLHTYCLDFLETTT